MEREAALIHKIESAREVHDNITTPGWINNKAPKALKLRLDGDVMEISKNFMGEQMPNGRRRIGVKGIKKNLETVIPGYNQELANIRANKYLHTAQALEKRQQALPPAENLTNLANRIIGLVPEATVNSWFTRGTLTREQYQQQAIDFARLALQVQADGGPAFNPMEIVNTPDAQRLEATQTAIRRLLSQTIISQPQKQLGELDQLWGHELRELIRWLGGGGTRLVGNNSRNSKSPIYEETTVGN